MVSQLYKLTRTRWMQHEAHDCDAQTERGEWGRLISVTGLGHQTSDEKGKYERQFETPDSLSPPPPPSHWHPTPTPHPPHINCFCHSDVRWHCRKVTDACDFEAPPPLLLLLLLRIRQQSRERAWGNLSILPRFVTFICCQTLRADQLRGNWKKLPEWIPPGSSVNRKVSASHLNCIGFSE